MLMIVIFVIFIFDDKTMTIRNYAYLTVFG